MAESGNPAEKPSPSPAQSGRMSPKLAKAGLLAVVLLAALYASACASFELFGRKMLYHPSTDVVAPDLAGLRRGRRSEVDEEHSPAAELRGRCRALAVHENSP